MKTWIAAILLLALPVSALGETYPDYYSTYVNDFADLIEPETEARIEAALKAVKADRGVEMTVVTIHSLGDYDARGDIADYATNLFNHWGVGDPERNDGILILIADQDRSMRIALGSGYGPVFDDRMQAVIDHHFLPWFREGNYDRGIEAGVDETIVRTTLDYVDTQDNGDTGTSVAAWLLPLLGGGLVVSGGGVGGIFLQRRWRRNRPRACPKCGRQMQRLSETADDAHLSKGQIAEEGLASVDYDVWRCSHDSELRIESYPAFWGRKPLCPDCGFHTITSTRRTIESATKTRSGRAEVTLDCANCDYHHVKTVTIPMVSDSSSSSGGSSFSGGSSSGGGASGSW